MTRRSAEDFGALENDVAGNLVMVAMLVVVLAITLGCLLSAAAVQRWIGETGMNVVSRILGILLAALAADMILTRRCGGAERRGP